MGRLTSIDRAFTDETRTYDNADHLLTIDNASVGQDTYIWDANSNKLSETWTGNMAASPVQEYVYADGIDSLVLLSSNSDADRYPMSYGYTSRRHGAESGLMYFRARYYDPSTGEFTSRDPLKRISNTSKPNFQNLGTCVI